MCGIVGFVNQKQHFETEKDKNVISTMMHEIRRRGPDEDGYFVSPHACLGHKRLIVIDPKGRKATYDRTF